jgi:hypothetical protein
LHSADFGFGPPLFGNRRRRDPERFAGMLRVSIREHLESLESLVIP